MDGTVLILGGARVTVKVVKCNDMPVGDNGEALSGLCDYETQEISVSDACTGLALHRVLGHEIVHHWLHWAGMDEVVNKLDDTGKVLEGLCNAIGVAFVDYLMNNQPKFIIPTPHPSEPCCEAHA